jgi:Flp pilus assembly protein TadD
MKRFASAAGMTLALSLVAGSALAQMSSARGRVIDADGKGVADAQVRFEKGGDAPAVRDTKTKVTGEFTITTQSTGPWTIRVKKDGYLPYMSDVPVKLSFGDVKEIDVITIYAVGDSRAPLPKGVTKEQMDEQKKFMELKAQFDAANALVREAQTAAKAGDNALATQKYDAAEAAFKGVLEKDPSIAQLHFNLGIVYRARQKWAEAADSFLKAAELSPEMAEAYEMAAVYYENAKNNTKAEEVLTTAATKYPDNAKFQFRIAELHFEQGKYAEAEPVFKKIQQADPTAAEVLYYLGTIAIANGRTSECVQLYDKYLAMQPAPPAPPTNQEHVDTAKAILQEYKPKKK